jgi:5-formyltetrahydrofolate cyclo-ligase
VAIPESIPPKSQLRSLMRQALRDAESSPDRACAALLDWLRARPDLRTIAVYAALPGEVDLSTSLRLLPEIHWVFPKVTSSQLTFHRVENFASELIPGSFGILEPADHLPAVPLWEIDAFICPGLAFDPRGGRLGRGRGYYDRILAEARDDALKIGICFAFQLVDDTYAEAHDIHMNHVITG